MRTALFALTCMLASASSSSAQQCLHAEGEIAEQAARRREAVGAARLVNTLQANQPGASSGKYLSHADLPSVAPDATARIQLAPGQDIVAGWRLTLDVTPKGYWFAIKDTADPCGFTLVSNESGVILRAEPLR